MYYVFINLVSFASVKVKFGSCEFAMFETSKFIDRRFNFKCDYQGKFELRATKVCLSKQEVSGN